MRANAEIREEKAKRVADLEAARQDLYTWFSMHEDVKPFLFFLRFWFSVLFLLE